MRWLGIVVLIGLLAGAGVWLWWSRPEAPVSTTPGSSRPGPKPVKPLTSDQQQAREAVLSYVGHLEKREYQQAYRLLSAESRRVHSPEEFARLAKENLTFYREDAEVRVDPLQPGRAEVTLQVAEEPGSWEFSLAREPGGWRVIYLAGLPGQPYPDQAAGRPAPAPERN